MHRRINDVIASDKPIFDIDIDGVFVDKMTQIVLFLVSEKSASAEDGTLPRK